MSMLRFVIALLAVLLVGCSTSPLKVASPDITVEICKTDDSLKAGSGLKAGKGGSGLKQR